MGLLGLFISYFPHLTCLSFCIYGLKAFYRNHIKVNVPLNMLDMKKTKKLFMAYNFFENVILKFYKLKIIISKMWSWNHFSVEELLQIETRKMIVKNGRKLKLDQLQSHIQVQIQEFAGVKTFVFTPVDPDNPDNQNFIKASTFFYHGGGHCVFDVEVEYFNWCQTLAKRTKTRVFAPEYRLAPEHKSPAGFEDCYNSTVEIIKQFKLKNYVITGDSAGGHLAMATVLQMSKSFNGPGQEIIERPLCLDLIWPVLHVLHLKDISFMNNGYPILDVKRVSAFLAFCSIKGYKSSYQEIFSQGKLISLIGKEEAKQLLARVNFKADKAKASITYERSLIPQEILKQQDRIVNLLRDERLNPLSVSDETLIKTLNFVKSKVNLTYCQYDVLRDQSKILLERINEFQKDNLIKPEIVENYVEGGFHGFNLFSKAKMGKVDGYGQVIGKKSEKDNEVDKMFALIEQALDTI